MKTPISDFVNNYIGSKTSRLHMPGHKGKSFLGFEKYDITEIDGADVLYSADGIINESENNASHLFKTAHTFYSAGGSTLAIYAMLALACKSEKKPLILAARNVHKAFVHACALLDCSVNWLLPDDFSHICRCDITAEAAERAIRQSNIKPSAVYLTSPDYLGNMQNIAEISKICKKYSIPFLVDNAHGAYLGFLEKSLHPIHLGADMCCDSAHKTLPALTGSAYLHISNDAPKEFLKNARAMLSVFSSTSPSYLILQSLDILNDYLETRFRSELDDCIIKIEKLKMLIRSRGFEVNYTEPLKIVINAVQSGYTGNELAHILRQNKIEAEFYDKDFLVLMVSPQNDETDFERIKNCFLNLTVNNPLPHCSQKITVNKKMSIREAVFSDFETIDVQKCEGRICASPTVSCPPAVPIVISGEEITKEAIDLFQYYNIDTINVVKNN